LIAWTPPASLEKKDKKRPVDTQTRHALKSNSFAEATASSVNWLSGHRTGLIRWIAAVVVVLVLGIGALIFWNVRTSAADEALGAALDTYNASLAEPGIPAGNGVYATAADRSRAANKQFNEVAAQYGFLPEGSKAHYFAGVTALDLGQTGTAESELKTAAGAWDRNLANLAKVALAGLYRQTQRDSQAVDIYNGIVSKPSDTVSVAVAQLDLADLYAAEGKQDQARALWAKVKDADKDGMAGQIASQKLGAQ
jgi:predicted negative regulator of RcsB-dependent stress response